MSYTNTSYVESDLEVNGNAIMNKYIQFNDIVAPSNPLDGQGLIYKKTGDASIYWKSDSAGAEFNLKSSDIINSTTTAIDVASSAAPSVGQILIATGSTAATWQSAPGLNNIYGTIYEYIEDLTNSAGTNTTYVQKLKLTTAVVPAGDYLISWAYDLKTDSRGSYVSGRVQLDDTIDLHISQFHFRVTSDYNTVSSFAKVTLTNASHDIDIDYLAETTGVQIKNARIAVTSLN